MEFLKCDILWIKKLFADALELRADTDIGQAGCSTWQLAYEVGYHVSVESCKKYCDRRLIEYHLSSYCSCFNECDFMRPASEYGSPAKVYEVTSKSFFILKFR